MFTAVPFEQKAVSPRLPDGVFHDANDKPTEIRLPGSVSYPPKAGNFTQHGCAPHDPDDLRRAHGPLPDRSQPAVPSMAISVKFDDDLKSRIQRLADTWHRSAHWVMREAIRDYAERKEARERFKQEALASWTAYQETGQHLAGKN